MDRQDILNTILQREPFLFVDDILSVDYGKSVEGVKEVKADEPWAKGHFPGEPVFPGVLMLETMAQIGCFLYYKGKDTGKVKAILSKIEDAKFLKKVVPGDRIVVKGNLIESIGQFSKIKCVATANGEVAAKATVTYYIEE